MLKKYYICYVIKNKTMKTKKISLEEKLELIKLLYKMMNMGDSNSLIRQYFGITKRKEWIEFMTDRIKLLDN